MYPDLKKKDFRYLEIRSSINSIPCAVFLFFHEYIAIIEIDDLNIIHENYQKHRKIIGILEGFSPGLGLV